MLFNRIQAKRVKLPGRIEFTNANIFHVLIIMSLGGNLNAISTESL